jgi:hypothetical protein
VVLAVLGHRIVNYCLSLIQGAVVYLRLRLRAGAAAERDPEGNIARTSRAVCVTTDRTRSSSYSGGQYHESRRRLYSPETLGVNSR